MFGDSRKNRSKFFPLNDEAIKKLQKEIATYPNINSKSYIKLSKENGWPSISTLKDETGKTWGQLFGDRRSRAYNENMIDFPELLSDHKTGTTIEDSAQSINGSVAKF